MPYQVTDTAGTTQRYQYTYGYGISAFPTLVTTLNHTDLLNNNYTESYTLSYYYNPNTTSVLNGKLQAVTDPTHHTTYYTYYANGQLQSRSLNYTGTISATADPTANNGSQLPTYVAWDQNVTTKYVYDADGRLIDVIDMQSLRDDHTCYGDFNRTNNTCSPSLTYTITQTLNYKSGLPTKASQNVSTSTHYNGSGLPLQIIDPQGNTTTFSYDSSGRLHQVDRQNPPSEDVITTYAYAAGSSVPGYSQVQITHKVSATKSITDVVCYDQLHRVTGYLENFSGSSWDCQYAHLPTGGVDQNALTEIWYSQGTAQGHEPWEIINHLSNIQTNFTYDTFGRVSTTTFKDNAPNPAVAQAVWTNYYDQFGRLKEQVAPLYQSNPPYHFVFQCYDMNNRVVYQVLNATSTPGCSNDGSGSAWSAPPAYPSYNSAAPAQDTNIQSWTKYDGLGRVTDTYDPIGRRNTTGYDGIGRVISSTKNYDTTKYSGQFSLTDPQYNNTTTVVYDMVALTQTATQWFGAVGQQTTPSRATFTQFDLLGHKLQVNQNATSNWTATDQNVVTLYQYDFLGRVIEQSNPATDPSPQFLTDGSGGIAGGQTNYTSFTYDALGHKLTIKNPSSEVTTAAYDDLGEQTSIVGPDTPLIAYTYDGLQRQTSQQVGSITLSTGYSSFVSQRAIIQTDGNGVQTKLLADMYGDPSSVIQNLNMVGVDNDQNVETDFKYDLQGDLTGVKLPGSSQWARTYVYDNADRLQKIQQLVDGVQQTWLTYYDAAGRVVTSQTPQQYNTANQTATVYDALNEVTNIQRANSADNVAFNYSYIPVSGNGVNEQVKMTDGTANPTYSNYDDMNRLIGMSGGETNQPLAYSYDKGGEGLTLSLPGGRTATYAYNPNGTLATVTLNSSWSNAGTNGITSYNYYQGHLLKTVTFPNGILETLTYDQYNRLSSLDYTVTATSTTLFHIDYSSIDNNGNRTVVNEYLKQSSLCTGTCTASETDTIGVYRSSSNTFYLRNTNSTGSADVTATLSPSPAAHTPYPVVGNWSGSGKDTIGLFDQYNGTVYLRNTNTSGAPDTQFTFGAANDVPLAGRWSAVNPKDGFGVWRPSNGLIYLKNALTSGSADYTLVLGIPGDQGVAGNWTNANVDGIGVYRLRTSYFYLVNTVTNGTLTVNYSFQYGTANGGYTSLVGDWTGSTSGFGVGLFLSGTFSLKNQLAAGNADNTFQFGIAGDIPVAGNWQTAHMPAPNVLVPPTATPITPVNPAPTSVAPPTDGLIDMAPPPPQPMSYIDPSATTNLPSDSASAMPATSFSNLMHRQIVYGYDNLNRLTGAQYQDNGVDTYNFAYTYDQNSNRLTSSELFAPTSAILDNTQYTYNEDNQLKSALDMTGGNTTYGYSPDGMVTGISYQPHGGSNTAQQGFSYDTADRLTYNINYTASLGISYLYNGQDNLARKSVSAGNTYINYLVDPSGQLPHLMVEYPSSGAATYYAPGLGQDQNGTFNYFGHDGLGSVRTLFDTSGTQRSLINYTPYGSTLGVGSTLEKFGDLNSHLGFTGALTDDSGLIYLNARFYNPVSGQFMSADPLEGSAGKPASFNKYGYVQGSPVNMTDPSGEMSNDCTDNCDLAGGPAIGGDSEGGGNISIVSSGTPDFDSESVSYTTTDDGVTITSTGTSGSVTTTITYNPDGTIASNVTTTSDASGIHIETTTYNADGSTTTTDTNPLSEVCSFAPETLVETDHGEVPISKLKTGDKVLAYNQKTGKTEYKTVDAVLDHADSITEDLTINGETIHTTPDHRFFTLDRGWVGAGDLRTGEFVRNADGLYGAVQSIVKVAHRQVMYNLTVDIAHTYFVGDGQWLVHNDCGINFHLTGEAEVYDVPIDANHPDMPTDGMPADGSSNALFGYDQNGNLTQISLYDSDGNVIYQIDKPDPTSPYPNSQVWHYHDITEAPGDPSVGHGPSDALHHPIGGDDQLIQELNNMGFNVDSSIFHHNW